MSNNNLTGLQFRH